MWTLLSVADLAAPVARLDEAVRPENDEAANTVDLRLDDVPARVGNGSPHRAEAVVRDELREDVEHLVRGCRALG
jgi:hypothetical protein